MSTTNQGGSKILLERSRRDLFWDIVSKRYAHDDPRKWRYLAMLALRENAQWPLELIGKAFGHHRGHVMRCLNRVREQLRAELGQEPNLWGDDTETLAADEITAEDITADEIETAPVDIFSSPAEPSDC